MGIDPRVSFIRIVALLITTGALLPVDCAEAGVLHHCQSLFGFWMDRLSTPNLDPETTSIEFWLKSTDPLNSLSPLGSRQEVKVTTQRPQKLSPEKTALLKLEFDSTVKTLQDPHSLKDSKLLIRHIQAASGILESDGVNHLVRTRHPADRSALSPSTFEIVLLPGGETELNRLTAGVGRILPGSELIYSPELAAQKGFAAGFLKGSKDLFNSKNAVLFIPSNAITGSISESLALRHELQHAYYEHLRLSGKPLEWMHGSYVNSSQSPFKPSIFSNDQRYRDYLSFEELAIFKQDLVVQLMRMIRHKPSGSELEDIAYRVSQLLEFSEKINALGQLLKTTAESIPRDIKSFKDLSWITKFQEIPLFATVAESSTNKLRIIEFKYSEAPDSKKNLNFSIELALNRDPPLPLEEAVLKRATELMRESDRITRLIHKLQRAIPVGSLIKPENFHEIETILKNLGRSRP